MGLRVIISEISIEYCIDICYILNKENADNSERRMNNEQQRKDYSIIRCYPRL